MPTKKVWLVACPGTELLDLAGPSAVFAQANEEARQDAYQVQVVGVGPPALPTSNGISVWAHQGIDEALKEGLPHTLIVAGGANRAEEGSPEWELAQWLRTHGKDIPRLVSVCLGAYCLAESGLVDGHRITTHWGFARDLARKYPQIVVDPDPIYVEDKGIWTSAGVTAGLDLCLALVEKDEGRTVALGVARRLVVYMRRPGNQAQFSGPLVHNLDSVEPLEDLPRWIREHLRQPLTVDDLAEQAKMSRRQLTRTFKKNYQLSPAQYIMRMRVDEARKLLESSALRISSIAQQVGFGGESTMRRAFMQLLGVSPSDYRERFSLTSGPVPSELSEHALPLAHNYPS